MPPAEPTRSLCRAVALGLIQGPSELLPISSSAHTRLIPWLAGWEPQAETRDSSFELALHGGACCALTLQMAPELRRELGPWGPRKLAGTALALAPPALAGLALRGFIERRLSGPRACATGLLAGGVAMALADARAPADGRSAAQAGPADGLAIGLAQALALAPGVSRNGATLTAARARGFSRPAAQRLSWAAGLPVMAAAALFDAGSATGRRSAGAEGGRGGARAGGAAAFCSTLLSARARSGVIARGALWPYSLYRCLLAGLVLARAGRDAHNR